MTTLFYTVGVFSLESFRSKVVASYMINCDLTLICKYSINNVHTRPFMCHNGEKIPF